MEHNKRASTISPEERAELLKPRYCQECNGLIPYRSATGRAVAPRVYAVRVVCANSYCKSKYKHKVSVAKSQGNYTIPYVFKAIDYFILGRVSEMVNVKH